MGAMGDADAFEQLRNPRCSLGWWGADQLEREFHVLRRGERGKKVEELEDRADALPAQTGEAVRRQRFEGFAMKADGPGVGSVDATEAVQEGGLARTGGPDECEAFASAQGEAYPAQHRTPVIGLLDVPGLDDGSGGSGWIRVFQGVGTVRRRRPGANGDLLRAHTAESIPTLPAFKTERQRPVVLPSPCPKRRGRRHPGGAKPRADQSFAIDSSRMPIRLPMDSTVSSPMFEMRKVVPLILP